MSKSEKFSEISKQRIERRSLTISKWANLFMSFCGILAAWLSHSEAIMLDGLYSGIGFISAVFATRIGDSINRPADRQRPFGYDADEALYTTFRSLSLLGLILFAVFSATINIVTYATGGQVPQLIFGPIIIYFLVVCSICAGLALTHRINWKRTGKKSEILNLEFRAAIVDGAITLSAGLGLMAIPLLSGTALAFIVPIGDSIVLLFLGAIVVVHPVYSFRQGLAELAGVSANSKTVRTMNRIVKKQTDALKMRIVDVSVNKLGRRFVAAVYIDPDHPIGSEEVDQLTLDIEAAADNEIGKTRVYIIISKHGREWNYSRLS